uniref:NAD-dependent protein deacetylase n=1 Tax=Pseudonaja textilis TaxID=8673 RepID=A0A670ZPH1_PSETE
MASREGAAASPEQGAEKASKSSSSDSDEEGGASGQTEMEFLRNLFSRTLGFGSEKPEKVLEELTLEGVTNFILTEKCKNIICMVGAGISTSAGIPDFRSPGTGLYANLQQYSLPYPEAIFEIGYFKQNPEPFFALARELYPGQFKPTVCHYFIRLLKDKGLLLRCYTQNIDTLERVAGLDAEHLVEAHGTFYTSHCISSTCKASYSLEWMKEKIFASVTPRCEKCQSVVKPGEPLTRSSLRATSWDLGAYRSGFREPERLCFLFLPSDIVFFGENLPPRFFSLMQSDFQNADMLIIMGTSLQVQPFASLVSRVPTNTPRLLINKEKTGESDPFMSLMGLGCGMDFDSEKAYRDVAWLGDCDEGCLALAELLGWKKELQELVKKEHAVIDAQSGQTAGVGAGAGQQPAKKQEQNLSSEKEKPAAKKEK